MSTELCGYLIRQLDLSWALASYHLETLTTDECLWRPAASGLHVSRDPEGLWRPDWPDRETYDLGPSSIAWLTWHWAFWWSMVIDHSFGDAKLGKDDVRWPGDADGTRAQLRSLFEAWRGQLVQLTDEDLRSTSRTRFPFKDRPFGDVVAWANVELTKSAAELGYARFLHAVRSRP